MIEEILINYGTLGAWTIWLLYEKRKLLSEMQRVLSENTQALKSICNYLKGGK